MAPGRPRLRLPRFSALQHVSVLPDVWRMCSFTVCLSFLLCQVYNPIRRAVRDGQKKTLLFYVFHDCDAFFNMCTTFVTFILSFFNATVFTRWWRLRELCGTVNGQTVDTVVLLSGHVQKAEDMETLMRLLWLAHALHVASIDPALTSDPQEGMEKVLQGLLDDALLTKGEAEALRPMALDSSTPLSVAYSWFNAHFSRVLRRDVPPSMHGALLNRVSGNVSKMRGAAASVLMYLSTPVPLAYTQLLELMVTIYVMMAPLGLVPRLLWMAVPGCFIVTLVFYGFMSLGKLMLNPFVATSEDAFDTQAFLRSTRASCRAVADAAGPPTDMVLPVPVSSSASLLHSDRNSVGLRLAGLFGVGIPATGEASPPESGLAHDMHSLPSSQRVKGPLLKGALSHRAIPPPRGATSPHSPPGVANLTAEGGGYSGHCGDHVAEEPPWASSHGGTSTSGLRRRGESRGPGISPGSSPWLGPKSDSSAGSSGHHAQSPSLLYGLGT
mmetsp:Transcript_27486/g.83621  ORF Transcript_27486/g.83621 Transcript_27486/m.83621 type:complete len:497 (+) Transcript_27486:283-1773(+)